MQVSDSNPVKDGILGAKIPHPWENNADWRVFCTQQHGYSPTYEVIRVAK